MLERQIGRYERLVAKEEKLAGEARSADVALAHHQVAMLYRTELAIMRSRRAVTLSETLAETW